MQFLNGRFEQNKSGTIKNIKTGSFHTVSFFLSYIRSLMRNTNERRVLLWQKRQRQQQG